MASLKENLSYLRVAIEHELLFAREQAAAEVERRMKAQVQSGEGQRPYSTRAGWFNITRIERFYQRLSQRRDTRGKFQRSRYGKAAVFFEGGYAEFRQAVGRQTAKVDFNLTGEMVDALKARAVRAKGGGLHLWVAFDHQRRAYGRLTNSQLAEVVAERSGIDPFRIDEIGEDVTKLLIEQVLTRTGAQ